MIVFFYVFGCVLLCACGYLCLSCNRCVVVCLCIWLFARLLGCAACCLLFVFWCVCVYA